MLSLEDMSAINKEFSDVWNSNDIDKLREFNEKTECAGGGLSDIRKEGEKMALLPLQTCILPFPWISPWIFLGKTGRITVKKSSQAGRNISPKKILFFAGDLSWGMRIDEAAADLDVIYSLPGRKILRRQP